MAKKYDMRENVLLWGTDIESLLVTENTYSSRGHTMQEHVHQYYELVFNYSSIPLRHTVVGRAYETNTPCILFRSPYVLHSTVTLDRQIYTRCNIGFHPCVLTEFSGICDLGRLKHCWELMIPATDRQMAELEPLLVRLKRVRDPAVPKKVWLSTLATLLYEVSELSAAAISHELPTPPYMQELLRCVVEHVEEELTIDTLAEKFFVSRAKLTRDFRATVGTSLHNYISSIRIHRAKILLAQNLPLAFVAQQCGFSGDSSLVTMFRRATGMTPGEYRRKLNKQQQENSSLEKI